MKKICFVLTIPFTLNAFLRPHLERLSTRYDITICLNLDDSTIHPVVPGHVRLVPLGIVRQINVWSDLKTLFVLTRFMHHEKFELVYSLTPKGGLLAMMAAWLAGAPNRVHCFTGQVWATRRGFWRWALKRLDRVLAVCATRLLADSGSQRQFLIDEGVTGAEKIEVLANGSMAGVDAERFRPDKNARTRIRARLGIEDSAFCLLFVGRLTREKGVPELIEAFNRLRQIHPGLQLLLVGPDEEGFDSVVPAIQGVHRVGYTQAVEEYMAAADVFCLPSYREGFGLVLIEAGAVGLPVVASRIYGVTDAVLDGETGLLHRPGDVADLVSKLEILITDGSLLRAYGEAGRLRALRMFGAEQVTTALVDFFQRLLDKPTLQVK